MLLKDGTLAKLLTLTLTTNSRLIEVVVPRALPMKRLTYRCDSATVSVGVRVVVPLGETKEIIAVVAAVDVEYGGDPASIKDVIEVIDRVPLVSGGDIEFLEWVASYNMCKVGDVVRDGWGYLFSVEMSRTNSSLRRKREEGKEPLPQAITLNHEITLLHTFERVDIAAICANFDHTTGHILVLAPTHQRAVALDKELSRYYTTALYTTKTSIKKRCELAAKIATGLSPQVIIGTRMSLWLSHENLRGVVVTREESFHYRSGAAPFYSTRECATMLSALHSVRCVLTSAFPSVESYYNAKYGQWGYIAPNEPAKELRHIVLERGRDMISKYAKGRIAECLEEGLRVILLQNRRGVASYVECEACGYVPHCPNCSVSLTLHRRVMGCHYCGHTEEIEPKCKECGTQMVNRGRGTQQIEEQLATLYPLASIARLDSDNLSEVRDIVSSKDKSWNIAIGTTMLLESEVWDEVGLVAVLNVDNMLTTPDFRVEEHAYRTLGELSLRCRESGGELIIQSSRLDHRVINNLLTSEHHDFYKTQIIERQHSKFPPHSRMIRLEFRGENLADTSSLASRIEDKLRTTFGARLSPIYSPQVERQRGEYIIEMTLKIERTASLTRAKELLLTTIKELFPSNSKISLTLENL